MGKTRSSVSQRGKEVGRWDPRGPYIPYESPEVHPREAKRSEIAEERPAGRERRHRKEPMRRA